jgi:hypothetical protein
MVSFMCASVPVGLMCVGAPVFASMRLFFVKPLCKESAMLV